MFSPCIINFHKTGTVNLGRNPFSSFQQSCFYFELNEQCEEQYCFSDSLCWKISKDLGFERIEFEKLEKSVAFLPSEVFLVKCQYLVLLYYNQSLETTRFHIQPIKDN